LFAVTIAGCGQPDVLDFDYRGSDAGFASATRAALEWNSACGVELVRVGRGSGIPLVEQEGTVHGAMGETTRERPVLGAIGAKETTDIHFMRGSYAMPTLAHEFGHAMGLGHADRGVMRPGGQLDVMDPTTERKTLLPGSIAPEDCAAVMR
jgi:hypothetical protein